MDEVKLAAKRLFLIATVIAPGFEQNALIEAHQLAYRFASLEK